MKRTIGILLIILSVWIGFDAIQKFDASEENVRFLGIRIHTEDNSAKQTAFVELALCALVLAGGVSLLNDKRALV